VAEDHGYQAEDHGYQAEDHGYQKVTPQGLRCRCRCDQPRGKHRAGCLEVWSSCGRPRKPCSTSKHPGLPPARWPPRRPWSVWRSLQCRLAVKATSSAGRSACKRVRNVDHAFQVRGRGSPRQPSSPEPHHRLDTRQGPRAGYGNLRWQCVWPRYLNYSEGQDCSIPRRRGDRGTGAADQLERRADPTRVRRGDQLKWLPEVAGSPLGSRPVLGQGPEGRFKASLHLSSHPQQRTAGDGPTLLRCRRSPEIARWWSAALSRKWPLNVAA